MDRSPILPVAWITLRILIVANAAIGVALLAFLFATFHYADWIWRALGVTEIAARPDGVAGMQAIVAVGIASTPMTGLILLELSRVVETVRRRDPFIRQNAGRIRTIAWTLLVLQLLQVAVNAIAAAISTEKTPLGMGGTTVTGWLAIVLLFVLASVFREGTTMRDELEGTV